MAKPIEVFFSYSHKDEKMRDQLADHLAALQRQGVIEKWNDRQITAGSEWAGRIDDHLKTADIILLLVSPSFLASNYCNDVEVNHAMKRHEAREATVIPIILRPSDWKGTPFSKLQVVPKNAKPVVNWKIRDEAFLNVVEGIKAAIKKITANSKLAGKGDAPKLSPIWNVPHSRNRNFTGREEILSDLREALESGRAAALTQAIHGLGGVGKTQLATEYAYRHGASYSVVWWVRSEQPASLRAEYAGLAAKLDLPEKEAQEQGVIVGAVKEWLRLNRNWLLVFDNAPDARSVREYIPTAGTGHVIVTSRDANWRGVAEPLTVRVLPESEAIKFLLKRTGQKDETTAATLAKELGYLPLALEQAAAYIEASGRSISHYLDLFREGKKEALQRGKPSTDYPETIATTWEVSFRQVESENAAAADLLKLCAFFAPDEIPMQVIKEGAKHLPERLASAAGDSFAFDDCLAALRRYSLMEVEAEFISVHRLVQAVTQHRMTPEAVKEWNEAAVRILNNAFPFDSDDVRTWEICSLLLSHALAALADAETLKLDEAATARLLNQVGLYLFGRAELKQAETIFKRALAIGEAAFSHSHPQVATFANNLGGVLKSLGDLAGAKALYERALQIFREFLGEDHPNTVTARNNLKLLGNP